MVGLTAQSRPYAKMLRQEMMQVITVEQVKQRIEQALPGARVQVDVFQGNDHFQALVEASQFDGKSLIEQHQMVYAALDGLIGGAMHALALKTRVLETTG